MLLPMRSVSGNVEKVGISNKRRKNHQEKLLTTESDRLTSVVPSTFDGPLKSALKKGQKAITETPTRYFEP